MLKGDQRAERTILPDMKFVTAFSPMEFPRDYIF